MRRRFKLKWFALAAAVVALGAVFNVWLVTTLQYRRSLQKEGFVGELLAPGPQDRILVIAPHPDDEVIGCGGLIQQALDSRARVHVVVVTNGDGSELSLLLGEHEILHGPSEFIGLGEARQKESLAALGQLGLPAKDVEFLGYPNNGLLDMWQLDHWGPDHPYQSPNTRATRSPYENSLTPGAVYCGQQLLLDLMRVMLEVRPTAIFVTHPDDSHPDHWTTDAFTRYALATLAERGVEWAQEAQVYGYLVHWPSYPAPRRFLPRLGLLPPANLLRDDAGWQKLPLAKEQVKRKLVAIRKYHSQLPNLDRFLLAFARSNEMFAELPAAQRADGEARWLDEASPLHRLGGADITTVRMHRGGDGSASAEIETRRAHVPKDGAVVMDLRGWDERGRPVGTAVYAEGEGARVVRMDAATRLHPAEVTVERPQPGMIKLSRLPWPGSRQRPTAFLTCWGKGRGRLTDPAVVQVVERQ